MRVNATENFSDRLLRRIVKKLHIFQGKLLTDSETTTEIKTPASKVQLTY